jgi:hypothetical protein
MSFTTDSYGVDATRGSRSRFDAVIEAGVPEVDRSAVRRYAMFLFNTSPGGRPSDAAARAVSEYTANPDRIRNRASGCDPDTGRRPF